MGAIDLVHENRRNDSHNLESKVLRLDYIDRGDEIVEDNGETVGVLDGDSVGFTLDDDVCIVTLADENRVRDFGLDLDALFALEVFLQGEFVNFTYVELEGLIIRLTIIHLLPSSVFLGGFLTRMLSGFGFLPGAGLFPRTDPSRSGTVELALRDGFLCVI